MGSKEATRSRLSSVFSSRVCPPNDHKQAVPLQGHGTSIHKGVMRCLMVWFGLFVSDGMSEVMVKVAPSQSTAPIFIR